MSMVRKQVKNLVEGSSGYEIERFGHRSCIFLSKRERPEAWFSHRTQLMLLMEKFDVTTVLDVGANVGQFARYLRSFYSGEIFSFEPVSSVFDKLHVRASDDSHWHVHKLALGRQDSTHTIYVSDETVFSSLLKTNDYCAQRFGAGSLATKEEIVSVRRLDKLLDELIPDIENQRIFLKLDTQGYDMEVFKGLGDKLKYVVILQSEVSLVSLYERMPHWTESIAMYESAGFGVVGMFPVNRDSERIIEYDCLLARVRS